MDWSPAWISLRVASCATVLSIVGGLFIAYPLARARFPGRDVVAGLTTVPLVLPPTVLGYALLVAFGRHSVLGKTYEHITGFPLVFTWQGAVLAASVASIPLFIGHALTAFGQVDEEVIAAARLDGARGWAIARYIIGPLALPGLLAGASMAFARAIGEYGATMMFAGDTPGETQTMPLAIYDAFVYSDNTTIPNVFGALSIAVAVTVCVLTSRLGAVRKSRGG